MAETRTEKFQAPSWPTLFAAATALSGVIWYFAPLSTSRPGGAAGPEQAARPGYQNVDARLWQDPLEPALADVRAGDQQSATHPRIQIDLGPRSEQDKRHDPKALLQEQPDAAKLIVMPVMLETGPYTDSAEKRRRARNAIVSALHECHYVPDDSEHIGYITIEELARLPDEDSKATRPAGAGVVIPFEWFRGQASSSDYVVVLWLDEGSFQQHPLRRLRILLDRLGLPGAKGLPTNWSVKVLGPRGSTTLQAMVADVATAAVPDRDFPPHDPLWARVDIYCGTATAPDAFVLHRYKSQLPGCSSVAEALGSRGVCFVRTTDDDFDLARALVAELKRRDVDVYNDAGDGDLIAIVSESDTFYGRMLPLAFQAAARYCGRGELDDVLGRYSNGQAFPKADCARITQFSYLRGIDGKLPGESDSKTDQAKPTGGGAGSSVRPRGAARINEAPEGQNQYDYLRRLSDELARLDQEDRAAHRYVPKQGGLKAVGVLGSDLYDKLLVLQALRARFPNIVFFTTDVDARMGSPSERRWAHNLVIASSYGLALDPLFQGEIPPFRDCYQTAIYCTALRALAWKPPQSRPSNSGDPLLSNALLDRQPISIFEVARSGVYDLAREAHPDLPHPGRDAIDVMPRLAAGAADWWAGWHVGLIVIAAVLLTILMLGLVFDMQWKRLGLRTRPLPHPWALLLAAGFIVIFIFWETGAGFIQNVGVADAHLSIGWFLIWGTLLVLAGAMLWGENGRCSPQAWPWARIAGGTLAVFILALGLSLALRPQSTGGTSSVFLQTLLRIACPIPGALVLGQVLLAQASKPEIAAYGRARPAAPESDSSTATTGQTGRRRSTRRWWAVCWALAVVAASLFITYRRSRVAAGPSKAAAIAEVLARGSPLFALALLVRPGRGPRTRPAAAEGGPTSPCAAPSAAPQTRVGPLAAARQAVSSAFAHVAGRISALLRVHSDRVTSIVAVIVSLLACWWVRNGLPHPWQAWLYLGFVAALALVPLYLIARVTWRQVRPRHEPLWPYMVVTLLVALAICSLTQRDRRNVWFLLDLSNLSPAWGAIIPVALVAAMLAAATVDVVRRPAKRLGPRQTDSTAPRLNLRPYFIVAALVVIVVTWAVTQNTMEGVPFAFFEGISIWPSEIIRGVSTVLAIHFFLQGLRDLKRVRGELGSTRIEGYCLDGAPPPPRKGDRRAASLWRTYLRQLQPLKTACRVLPMLGVYLAFAACLAFILGMPRTPVRGTISKYMDQFVLALGVLSLILLTVWVVDVTMTARRFIQRLSRASVAWPYPLLKAVATKRGMSPDDLDELLDVHFIGRLTTPIMHLIYYPFIVLTLMIVARLNIFADWDWPPALLVVFVLNSAWAVYAAYLLRDAAEKARDKTLRRLREKLLQIQGTGQDPRVEKIKETLHEIQSDRKGAFASFAQNPVIGAVLLPASAALLALLGNLAQAQ